MEDKEIISIIEQTLKDKLNNNSDFIKYTFYELRVKYNLSEQDTDRFLSLIRTKLQNENYKVYFTGTKFEYKDAKMLIQYVFNEYKGKYKRMIVGTTENMIPFYVLNGFTKYYKTVKNFFIDNYEHEIWDGNLQCIDMYYYCKEF